MTKKSQQSENVDDDNINLEADLNNAKSDRNFVPFERFGLSSEKLNSLIS